MKFVQTGAVMTANYQEPATNEDGSPITDLALTSIYYDMGQGPVKAAEVPASAPTGGGTVTHDIEVPVAPKQEVNVTFWITATDGSGNESAHGNDVVVRIDRLAPAPPL